MHFQLVWAFVLWGCASTLSPEIPADGSSDSETALSDTAPEQSLEDSMDVNSLDSADVVIPTDRIVVADANDETVRCNAPPVMLDPVYTFSLESAPFPNRSVPDVAVHIPPGFDPCAPIGVIAFFHGFNNCVTNVIGNTPRACSPGGSPRTALNLIGQLDNSRVNAILVAIEGPYDMANGDPGRLLIPGQFRQLLQELFTRHLATLLRRNIDVAMIDRVVLSSHSGGYRTVAAVLEYGQVPQITEVDLYDSLYGELATYYAWIELNRDRFDRTMTHSLRFLNVYTSFGGTADNSVAMGRDVERWFTMDNRSDVVLFDDIAANTLTIQDYEHPVIIKRSGLSHDGVPVYYFQYATQLAGFAAIP